MSVSIPSSNQQAIIRLDEPRREMTIVGGYVRLGASSGPVVLAMVGAACAGIGYNFDVEGAHLGDITYDDDFAVSQNGQATRKLPAGVRQVVPFTHEGRAPLTRSGSSIAIPGVGQ